jgi:hypothetical protein
MKTYERSCFSHRNPLQRASHLLIQAWARTDLRDRRRVSEDAAFSEAEVIMWLSYANVFIPRSLHRKLMQFRLCCWALEANRIRRDRSHVPREQPVCRCCGTTNTYNCCNVQLVMNELVLQWTHQRVRGANQGKARSEPRPAK